MSLTIPAAPDLPSLNDPTNFNSEAIALFSWLISQFIPAIENADAGDLFNLVGTVSESGGTPTGAIMEVGDNSNGSYLRLAGGTQLCWHDEHEISASAATSCNASWSYPSSFVDPPLTAIFLSLNSSDWTNVGLRTDVGGIGPFSATINSSNLGFLFSSGSQTLTVSNNRVIALGKWFT